MSWDCDMVIDTGGEELAVVCEVRNVTLNNSRIFSMLNVHPSTINGYTGEICALHVRQAQDKLAGAGGVFLDTLRIMEAANGWGGIEDVKDFLDKLIVACRRHPKAKVRFT